VKLWNFDQAAAHKRPPGWKNLAGAWQVLPDPTAPSQPNSFGLPSGRLFQSILHALDYYPMTIVSDDREYSDFVLEASFKSAGGRLDCSGGIIFRYAGPDSFYLLAAGCPNDYFTLTRVFKGKREVLKRKVVPTDKGVWYKLKVEAEGAHFNCFDDNKLIFETKDDKIPKGRIGFWARDDSQARFDDLTLTLPLPKPEAAEALPSEGLPTEGTTEEPPGGPGAGAPLPGLPE